MRPRCVTILVKQCICTLCYFTSVFSYKFQSTFSCDTSRALCYARKWMPRTCRNYLWRFNPEYITEYITLLKGYLRIACMTFLHDILEGTLQFEIKELLRSLIAEKHISLEDELFAYDPCKPSPISLSETVYCCSVWKFCVAASQMWCLARLLPQWLYSRRWMSLEEFFAAVEDCWFGLYTAAYLTYLIEDYLLTFKELFATSYLSSITWSTFPNGQYVLCFIVHDHVGVGRWQDIGACGLRQPLQGYFWIPKSIALRHQG